MFKKKKYTQKQRIVKLERENCILENDFQYKELLRRNKELKGHKKFRIKYSKIIVILDIMAIMLYTVASFILQNKGIIIDSTLTTCYFSFFGIDLLAMAGIKVSDTHNENKYQSKSNDYDNGVG